MKNIFRNCIYQGKNLFRDFNFSFWCLVYPFILAIFLYIAMNGVLNVKLENVNVGISSKNSIEYILKDMDFIRIHKIKEDDIEKNLGSNEIDGFIYDDLKIVVKESGINQSIIKEVVEQIKQMKKLNRPIENYDFSTSYISYKNQKTDPVTIVFYSLIAMVSTYGLFAGIQTVSLIQANLSNIGQRLNITPLKKSQFLLAGVLIALLLNLFANGLLLVFVKYVLKLNLFSGIKHSAILIIMGNLFGVSLGVFIGASNKKDSNVKNIMAISITLFLSFLSGMMNTNIKIMVDENLPILNKINPLAIITNNLYRINLLGSTESLGEGILVLSILSIFLILASYIFLRRKNYDSI